MTGFISWTLLLVVLMELIRTQLVLRGKVAANGFAPDNAGLSPRKAPLPAMAAGWRALRV